MTASSRGRMHQLERDGEALVLLRDPAGHENGTSKALKRLLAIGSESLPDSIDPDNDEVLSRVIFKRGL